jgi:hypothetical protein
MSTTYAGTAVYASPVTLPDDGDQAKLLILAAALEAILDRTEYLRVTPHSWHTENVAKNTPVTGVGTVQYAQNSSSYVAVATAQGYVDIPSTHAGDQLKIEAHFGLTVDTVGVDGFARIEVEDDHGGGSATVNTHLESEAYTTEAYSVGKPNDVARVILHQVAFAGTSRVRFALKCNGADNVQLRAPISIVVTHIRP